MARCPIFMISSFLNYKLLLISFLFTGLWLNGLTQSKEIKELISKGNYVDAIPKLKNAYKSSKEDPTLGVLLAECYLNTNIDKKQALQYLELAYESQKINSPDLVYKYALSLTYHLKYKAAYDLFLKYQNSRKGSFQKKVEIQIENCLMAMDLLENPLDVSFENLGKKINTRYPDYYPFVSKNDSVMYFTSRRSDNIGGSKEFDGYYPSDIYTYRIDYPLVRAKNIGAKLNTTGDDQVVGLSNDGAVLFIYFDVIDYFGDIYLAFNKNGKLTRNYKLDEAINSAHLETSASMSSDGQTLLFSSNRPGGFGKLDLYISRKLPDGKWGLAQNLGEHINTPFNEDFPQLSADGKTLFFSSDGHPGMGGFDIFKSIWNDEINNWNKPVNLGYPINTPEDNMTISFSNNERYAYVSANRDDSYGFQDIYRIEFNGVSMPKVIVIFERLNQKFDPSSEIIISNSEDEIVGVYRPNNEGKILAILTKGKYKFALEVTGEEKLNESFNVSNESIRNGSLEQIISYP